VIIYILLLRPPKVSSVVVWFLRRKLELGKIKHYPPFYLQLHPWNQGVVGGGFGATFDSNCMG
jgi:hypothetical protein